MDEQSLKRKLAAIEALFSGATTDGEREAAGRARERIRSALDALVPVERPGEFRFTFSNPWSRTLFMALCRRYGLEPFRYRGQRYTTVMVRVPQSFVDKTLWPQFEKLDDTLTSYVDEVTERVIREAIHDNTADAKEEAEPKALGTRR